MSVDSTRRWFKNIMILDVNDLVVVYLFHKTNKRRKLMGFGNIRINSILSPLDKMTSCAIPSSEETTRGHEITNDKLLICIYIKQMTALVHTKSWLIFQAGGRALVLLLSPLADEVYFPRDRISRAPLWQPVAILYFYRIPILRLNLKLSNFSDRNRTTRETTRLSREKKRPDLKTTLEAEKK